MIKKEDVLQIIDKILQRAEKAHFGEEAEVCLTLLRAQVVNMLEEPPLEDDMR